MFYAIGSDDCNFFKANMEEAWNGTIVERKISKIIIGARNFDIYRSINECEDMIFKIKKEEGRYDLSYLPIGSQKIDLDDLKIFELKVVKNNV